MGTIKDRNGTDLTEAENIKKRWQEEQKNYTKELYKKDLYELYRRTIQKRSSWSREPRWCNHSPRARHPGKRSQVALGSVTMHKASGGDGIPVERFQILKDDAVKVLHSICQQIWKTQQRPQDWKRSVFISIPKKGKAKECWNYYRIVRISHASKVVFKIFQARLQ